MFLDKYLNRKAFTALLVGSILAIMIGSVMLVVAYVVINAILTGIGTVSNSALNTSMQANISNITAALKRMKKRVQDSCSFNRSILHSEAYRWNFAYSCWDFRYHIHATGARINWQRWTPLSDSSTQRAAIAFSV